MIPTVNESGSSRPRRSEPGDAFDVAPPTRPSQMLCPVEVRSRGMLVETAGIQAGRPHAVGIDVSSIGRGRDCNVRLADDALSRVHARIVRAGAGYAIVDSGSLNGSFVNDRRVAYQILEDGDRLRLGSNTHLRFHLVDEEEAKAIVRLYESSALDGLTGVANRKHLEQQLAAEVAYALRHRSDLAVVMLDIDHFKRVNDTFGHPAGDAVLKNTAALIVAAVRAEDVVARYGGEELMVVARGIGVEGGRLLAERLRTTIAGAEVVYEGHAIRITSSFGVASLACCADASVVKLVARADERLYAAKAAGRNRVVSS